MSCSEGGSPVLGWGIPPGRGKDLGGDFGQDQ